MLCSTFYILSVQWPTDSKRAGAMSEWIWRPLQLVHLNSTCLSRYTSLDATAVSLETFSCTSEMRAACLCCQQYIRHQPSISHKSHGVFHTLQTYALIFVDIASTFWQLISPCLRKSYKTTKDLLRRCHAYHAEDWCSQAETSLL